MATLVEAKAQLKAVEDELARAVSKPESFNIVGTGHSGRSTTNRSLDELTRLRDYWQREVTRLTRGGVRVRQGVPR